MRIVLLTPRRRFLAYRNQVIETPKLSPAFLFAAVKVTEAVVHLRPRRLWRAFFGGDRAYRKVFRALLAAGVGTVAAEVAEFLLKTRFGKPGMWTAVPGFPDRAGGLS